MIGKTKYNNQEEQREAIDGEDEQYEQDRLTGDNAYSEYLKTLTGLLMTITHEDFTD
jgi:hypothetical protein